MTLVYRKIPSPVGELTLIARADALWAILWDKEDGSRIDLEPVSPAPDRHPILDRTAKQLAEYFEGKRTTFDVPCVIGGTPFQEAVWRELQRIPFGETRTYGEIAHALGRPKAVRAVGNANRCNRISIVVPCHRVIGSDGSLTGFAGGLSRKAKLLDWEARRLSR
jgi:methylated-DNA-[protein]-cysteine S-methyltransferase